MSLFTLRLLTLGCLSVAATAVVSPAYADDGDWMVRARVLQVSPSASSKLNLAVSNDTIPELDFTRFLDGNVALELILGTSSHDVSLGGTKLGSVKVLPPTLTAQYHFHSTDVIDPYLGVGLNYTRFYGVNLPAPLSVSNSSWGLALQAGVDFKFGDNLYFNVDVKKIGMKADIYSAGVKADTLTLDPLVIGIGVGMHF